MQVAMQEVVEVQGKEYGGTARGEGLGRPWEAEHGQGEMYAWDRLTNLPVASLLTLENHQVIPQMVIIASYNIIMGWAGHPCA